MLLLCTTPHVVFSQKTPQKAGLNTRHETLYFADTARLREKSLELGFLGGGFYYNGDLSNDDVIDAQNASIGGGLYLRKHLWPFLALRLNAIGGQIKSKDRAYPNRKSSFTSNLNEFSLQAEWDIFGKKRFRTVDTMPYTLDRYHQHSMVNIFRHRFAPYVFAGAGYFSFKATPKFDQAYNEAAGLDGKVAEDLRISGKRQNQWGLLFGGGLNFDMGRNWTLGAELGARAPLTDYLDGISQSANPGENDWYWLAAMHLAYRIGKHDRDGDGVADRDDKCPDIPGRGWAGGCPDADGDRIPDMKDECPHRKGVISMAGCPLKDMDNDSVPDVDDQCPQVFGEVRFNGCPDTDKDGVEDRLDSCATVAGKPEFFGCPDSDGDDIEDKLDKCPNEKGIPEYEGCAWRDTDRDSIEDRFDECPLIAGLAAFKGCPDTDKDGIEDRLDYCPTLPGKTENKGCPVIEKKDQQKLDLAVKAVKFETGKAILKPESSKILTDIADIMAKYEGYHLKIEGHTDNVGKDDKNLTLSVDRAKACLDFLLSKGVKIERLTSAGYGEGKPVADNKTPAGRASNRRVEFNLYLPEKK
jgi:OmpA-OmpF porin, OOP family